VGYFNQILTPLPLLLLSFDPPTHGFVGLVESGERKPNVELLWKVSKLFNVSADVLLDDECELE
jgi:transcriptional regulator with XRE-family HTH domain